MKYARSTVASALLSLGMTTPSLPSSSAFTPSIVAQSQPVMTTSATSLASAAIDGDSPADRRSVLGLGASVLFSGIVAASLPDDVAWAAEARPMYLTEPTEEFKANEAKSMEFKRQQLAVKKEFSSVLDQLLAEPKDEDAMVKDLKALKGLVAKTGGLPLGIKKDELFKIIRSKKAKGFWPTSVEVAYQSLQQEISFQQNPNLEKDTGNPYQ